MAAQNRDDEERNESAAEEALREKARRQLRRGRLSSLSDRLTGGPERPGEQKVGRSPLVLLLAGITVGAFLLAGIFWYINMQNAEERLLKEALNSLEQQKYIDAETQLARFIQVYPKTASTPVARIALHRSRVEKFIFSNTPDVIKGLEEFESLIDQCSDLPDFNKEAAHLERYCDRLTYASAVVAELSASQPALDTSRKSLEYLKRYSGEKGLSPTREQFLVDRQRIAEAAIAKKLQFSATLDRIKALLETGNTIEAIEARQALIDSYPSLATDKDVTRTLTEILTKEKEFVVRTDLGRDGLAAEAAAEPLPSLSLSLRTQSATDLVSQGRFVYSIGIDSCFAVDADTGDPKWKRTIGVDAPFAPVVIKGTGDGVLVYSTLHEELQLLSLEDGSLVWRQQTESRPTSTPLVVAGNIYITTAANELWQIAAVNGRAIAKLRFQQPVIGPPAVSSDDQRLVLPGDQTMVYVVSLNPFACVSASHIPHRRGSIGAPMLTAGNYYLMFDNDAADHARVQTLKEETNGQLSIVAADRVDGQIHDPALLRGYELYVPSTPQRITSFRVGDEPGQAPLALVGSNQLEEGLQTDMFLMAGPNNQVWLAGRDLRKFKVRSNGVELDPAATAQGVHVRPIQQLEEAVFLTTRMQQDLFASTFFTKSDRDAMSGIWRTVLGSRVVALSAASGGQSLLAVTDYGESYRVPLADLGKPSFALETVSEFRLPDKLASPIRGTVLADGRPAAWAGAPEPSMWTFSTTGQLERRWVLPDVPQIDPVVIDAGVVFALPGRLHLSGTAGGTAAEDYRSAQTQEQQQPWKSMVALSGTQILAISAANEFIRVEYRATPRPQLAELSVQKIPQLVELAPAVSSGFLFVPTADGKLLMMQASTLEILTEKDLGGVASATPRVAGPFVFVEVGGQTKIYRIEEGLPEAGTIPMNGASLAGNPIEVDGGILIASTNGLIRRILPDGTLDAAELRTGQGFQSGLIKVGDRVIATGLDGSLYQINADLSR